MPMLMLNRRVGEKILIGDDVWVTVIEIGHGRVLLGIEAPRDVPVHRQERLPPPPATPERTEP